MVQEKTGSKNVPVAEVGLHFGKVSDSQDRIVVGSARQFCENEFVILTIECVVKPHLALAQRTGKHQARQELVEPPAVLVLERGEKVSAGETEVIVSDSRVEAEHAARSFAKFGGLA